MLILPPRLFRPKPGQQLRPSPYLLPHDPSSSAAVTETQDHSVPITEEGTESLDAVGAYHDKRDDSLVGEPEQLRDSPQKQEGTVSLGPRFHPKTAGSYSPWNVQGSVGCPPLVFPRD